MFKCGLVDSQRRSGTLCKNPSCVGCRPYRPGEVRVVTAAGAQGRRHDEALASLKSQLSAAQDDAAHWLERATALDAKYARLRDICVQLLEACSAGGAVQSPPGQDLLQQLRDAL
jgi:hypothetical protein